MNPDFQPQRIRVRGDENAPLANPIGKNVHQRNKSATALSSMFENGIPKNGPKRSAFGDVSNKANLIRLAHDDSVAGKNQGKNLEKPSALLQDKKPGFLSQPAQRHASVAGVRGVLSNVTNSMPVDASGKLTGAPQQAANTRKTLNKKANTVFKDPSQPATETKETASKETRTTKAETRKGAPVSRSSTSLSQQADRAQSALKKEELEDNSVEIRAAEECSVVTADKVRADESKDNEAAKDDRKAHGVRISDIVEHGHPTRVDPPKSVDQGPAPSEPEEYWDDEEDEEDEDDGYLTTRSGRSRGDNTTGGATAVMFPKYNQQVRRELDVAKQIVEATRSPEDVEDEFWDTSMVAEYNDEIFDYMKEQEVSCLSCRLYAIAQGILTLLQIRLLPNAHYMDNQAEIQWSMRSVLMDWVVQVHHRFSLLPETLFLCVNYIDRFLSCKIVSFGKLQLVGATAIFIASKYEEIYRPSVQEICYMVDGAYTVDEILSAERFMLSMLRFDLGWPGPMSFLRRISKADDYDIETRTLAKYFLEITIMDERFVGSPPSFAAAGAHCLARLMLRKGSWVCSNNA